MIEKILILGASGFIGKNLAIFLSKKNVKVFCVSRSKKPVDLDGNDMIEYLQADLSDTKKLEKKIGENKIDVVINFAWNKTSGPERADFELQNQNCLNNLKFLEFLKKMRIKKYIGIGSVMENELFRMSNLPLETIEEGFHYALAKYNDHIRCKILASKMSINFCWVKLTNVYGPGEISKRLIYTILNSIKNNESMSFSSGLQLYDFVYIDDALEAFWIIINNYKNGDEITINSQNYLNLRWYIEKIYAMFNCDKYIFSTKNSSFFSLKKEDIECEILKKYGYKPKVSFEDGIKKTFLSLSK